MDERQHTRHMTQEQRLDYLVEAFKADSGEYRDLYTPHDEEGKRLLLRSLMNIRMPKKLPAEVLRVQDEYLSQRAAMRGGVSPAEIPTVREAYGSRRPFAEKLSLWQGDITRLAVDAIVNAANSQMLGCFQPCHACIDNCIHTYAGVQLRAACAAEMEALRQRYGRDYEQPTAVPMLTDAYNLPSKKVIHVVGPIVYDRLTSAHRQALADCYTNTLDLCAAKGLGSVAFCCISTGVFRFPGQEAAGIAVETVTQWLMAHPDAMDRVIFNVFTERDRSYYEQNLR